ncbi:MAG: peroxiredoxin-like family protein [Sphingomonadaceae bacterium]
MANAQLTAELAALRAHYAVHMPADIAAAMARADTALTASGIVDRALKAGQLAPDFTLPDHEGKPVRLSRVLRDGPVILTFYRGGWCPYCNLELRAYQALSAEMKAAGVRLIAVSPQAPDATAVTVSENALGFEVLSDVGSKVGRAYGVAFDLADELRPLYTRLGHALPDKNGADWVLPIPATYVIAPSGEIVLAFVDTDYRSRLEPADAIAAAIATRALRKAA